MYLILILNLIFKKVVKLMIAKGLQGIVVGNSTISSVGTGAGLSYRGINYSIYLIFKIYYL
jgi:hypothetical protein